MGKADQALSRGWGSGKCFRQPAVQYTHMARAEQTACMLIMCAMVTRHCNATLVSHTKHTLFCFIVVQPGKEFDLVPLHAASLKQCTDYAVYSNVSYHFEDSDILSTPVIDGSMDVPLEMTQYGPIATTNTKVLLPVWRHVVQQAARYDWVVKLDADTVVLIDRLRTVLAGLSTRLAQTPPFITNP